MNSSTLIPKLDKVSNYDDFVSLQIQLQKQDQSVLFDCLFPLAIAKRNEFPSQMAGYFLIALEPKFTRELEILINEITSSNWDISDKSVPLFLNAQFGKWNVKDCIDKKLMDQNLTENEKIRIKGLWYWAKTPAQYLASELCYWEWKEAIEGDENT